MRVCGRTSLAFCLMPTAFFILNSSTSQQPLWMSLLGAAYFAPALAQLLYFMCVVCLLRSFRFNSPKVLYCLVVIFEIASTVLLPVPFQMVFKFIMLLSVGKVLDSMSLGGTLNTPAATFWRDIARIPWHLEEGKRSAIRMILPSGNRYLLLMIPSLIILVIGMGMLFHGVQARPEHFIPILMISLAGAVLVQNVRAAFMIGRLRRNRVLSEILLTHLTSTEIISGVVSCNICHYGASILTVIVSFASFHHIMGFIGLDALSWVVMALLLVFVAYLIVSVVTLVATLNLSIRYRFSPLGALFGTLGVTVYVGVLTTLLFAWEVSSIGSVGMLEETLFVFVLIPTIVVCGAASHMYRMHREFEEIAHGILEPRRLLGSGREVKEFLAKLSGRHGGPEPVDPHANTDN